MFFFYISVCVELMCICGFVKMKWILKRAVCGCIDSLAMNHNTPQPTVYEKSIFEREWTSTPKHFICVHRNTIHHAGIPIWPLNYMVDIKRFSAARMWIVLMRPKWYQYNGSIGYCALTVKWKKISHKTLSQHALLAFDNRPYPSHNGRVWAKECTRTTGAHECLIRELEIGER